ncbi:SDR family NAD(P)-dependent oxidoreductase [Sphingomonas hankyongi]|uniref:SDR family oxidoreductase n=1 Tax=Sphingomonas hankyongi TaxID=2908209 RepID=A0ABT0S1L5_9SPHN|nr:SDR family oxidoreductase [Sphingomonas hankyongi]MCL6729764.1 SDR family oxidoreductase [Sphingomonas hankyongi]
MSLQGKVVVISGAGTGIGADAARAMRSAGASVVLNGRRPDKIEQVASSIDATGKNVECVAGDVGDPKISERIVKTAVDRFGAIDVLFNNAGIFEPKPFLEVSQSDLSGYFNLMGGYFALTQNAVRHMRARGGGAIISIGSIWAMQGIAATPSSAPSMAKGGIHSLTRALAIELAPDRIRVNAIAPGVVETPLFDPLLTSNELASFNAFHPLGRNGQPNDITSALLFLADDSASAWITGVVLPVDGGVMAGRNS